MSAHLSCAPDTVFLEQHGLLKLFFGGGGGEGVALEPCECRQHRSRSSLLRRMPVRGEYTMAPKLRTEAGLGADCGVLTHTAVQEPLASGAAPSTLGPRSPPRPRPRFAET